MCDRACNLTEAKTLGLLRPLCPNSGVWSSSDILSRCLRSRVLSNLVVDPVASSSVPLSVRCTRLAVTRFMQNLMSSSASNDKLVN